MHPSLLVHLNHQYMHFHSCQWWGDIMKLFQSSFGIIILIFAWPHSIKSSSKRLLVNKIYSFHFSYLLFQIIIWILSFLPFLCVIGVPLLFYPFNCIGNILRFFLYEHSLSALATTFFIFCYILQIPHLFGMEVFNSLKFQYALIVDHFNLKIKFVDWVSQFIVQLYHYALNIHFQLLSWCNMIFLMPRKNYITSCSDSWACILQYT